jgi:hypothetical protein
MWGDEGLPFLNGPPTTLEEWTLTILFYFLAKFGE